MLSEIVWILGTGILGLIFGYFLGKNEKERIRNENNPKTSEDSKTQEESTDRDEWQTRESETEQVKTLNHATRVQTEEWEIASPCGGEVEIFREKGKKGILIRSREECLYAPVAGKVIRIFPMGNAFILRTDKGVEITLRVGNNPDELCSMYYRPRMMCNEVVSKGKLLLEFDREKLQSAGEDDTVYLLPELGAWVQPLEAETEVTSPDDPWETVMEFTEQSRVKAGEVIIRIVKRKIIPGG